MFCSSMTHLRRSRCGCHIGSTPLLVLLYWLLGACGLQEFPHDQLAGSTDVVDSDNPLTIDGETVAKQDAIAFIHFGHSNMAGRAKTPASLRPYFFTITDPHAWMFHIADGLQPALEPFTASSPDHGMYAGPGTALVKEAAARAPGKHFISLGFGKPSAYCPQFLPGGLHYDRVMEAPRALKGRVTFAAIVIMLGITERHGTDEDTRQFPNCIAKLVTSIREELGVPNLPLLQSDYERPSRGDLRVDSPFARAIIPQIAKVPSVVDHSVIIPTDGIAMTSSRSHHFNMEGYLDWVSRALDLMEDNGWFPWAAE
jgi:hypothetical protein